MADDSTTEFDELTGIDPVATPDVPVVTIAFHPDRQLLGRRYALADGEKVLLGRSNTLFGRGALDHKLVSRNHARLDCRGPAVTVTDAGSRNGTVVNGERIDRVELEPGDVIGVGSVLLLFGYGPVMTRAPSSDRLVGVSPALGMIAQLVQRVAAIESVVLIQGETGVGKELVAQELHDRSGRDGQLVAINCAAVADGVVHSELFGHARGAFSGAERSRAGLVATAAGGTLLLDEIGDASAALQASLLRLLEQRSYRAVGDDQEQETDARFVAATHRRLDQEAAAGRFRSDLLARLERCIIEVPPLRERPEDIVPLALHFADQKRGEPTELHRSLALALLRHHWPRNVRELRTVIELACREAAEDQPLRLTKTVRQRLGDRATPPTAAPSAVLTDGQESAPEPRPARPSADELRDSLRAGHCNVSAVAAQYDVSRRTLYRWMKELDVDLTALRGEGD